MDDDSIQSYFDESRAALKSASDSETLSRNMRSELESYLDDASKIVDSEGEPLLSYPSNFDSVVEQMSREDVTSEEEKPWTKYLFSENFEKTLEKNFGQRYANLFQEEANEKKISYGLAEIHLLDNQLMKLTKQAAALKASVLKDNELGGRAPGTPGSESTTSDRASEVSRPGNASVMSRADMTFLTRLKGTSVADSNYDRAETPTTSRTARTAQFATSSSPSKGGSPSSNSLGKDLSTLLYDALLQTGPNHDNESKAYSKSTSGSTLASSKKEKRDFMKENINLVKNAGRSRLSEEEQEKVRLIMGEDLSSESDDKYMESLMKNEFRYGLSKEEEDLMQAIDQKLVSYGRMSRLDDTETTSRLLDSELGEISTRDGSSALTDQREAKLRQAYDRRLDSLLQELTSTNIDLTTLANNSYDKGGFDMYGDDDSSLLDVPDISQVKGGRSITVSDILEVVKQAKQDMPENFKSDETSTSKLQLNARYRSEIDIILSEYKGLVNKLGEMREQVRSSSSTSIGSGTKDQKTWDGENDDYDNNDDGAEDDEDDAYSYNSANPYVLSDTRKDALEILDKEIKKKALLPAIHSNNAMPAQLIRIFAKNDDNKVII